MELIIRQPRLMLTYPAHFHNPIIPKVGLSARGHYTFKKADTLSDPLPTKKASFRGQNRTLWRQRPGKCMIKYITSNIDLDLNDGDAVSKP